MRQASAASRLRVFINYRREETSGHAGRLYDALARHLGDDQIFMDIDRLEPGTDFVEVINREVGSSDVTLALIGNRWLRATDATGRRRLDSPTDYVRLELQAALDAGVRVIPVLVQEAQMPTPSELPRGLEPLARRHAVELSDTRWSYDVERLVQALERFALAKTPSGEEVPAIGPSANEPGGVIPDVRSEEPPPAQAAGTKRLTRTRVIVAALLVAVALAVATAVVLVVRGGKTGLRPQTTESTSQKSGSAAFSEPPGLFAPYSRSDASSTFEGNSFVFAVGKSPLLAIARETAPANVRIAVNSQKVSGTDAYAVGIICRFIHKREYYLFEVENPLHKVALVKYFEQTRGHYTTRTLIKQPSDAVSGGSAPNKLSATCTGEKPVVLQFVVNDHRVLKYVDRSGISGGTVGLRAETNGDRARIRFDRFKLGRV